MNLTPTDGSLINALAFAVVFSVTLLGVSKLCGAWEQTLEKRNEREACL